MFAKRLFVVLMIAMLALPALAILPSAGAHWSSGGGFGVATGTVTRD
jgi:hypothetical protein